MGGEGGTLGNYLRNNGIEYGFAGALPVMGPGALAFSGILLVISAAQWEYARRMARAGILA